MCYNCGCSNPDDDMGSLKNITNQTLTHLAQHLGKSEVQTKEMLFNFLSTNDPALESDANISAMFTEAAKAWGQSVDEAKKNTLALLKTQLKK